MNIVVHSVMIQANLRKQLFFFILGLPVPHILYIVVDGVIDSINSFTIMNGTLVEAFPERSPET